MRPGGSGGRGACSEGFKGRTTSCGILSVAGGRSGRLDVLVPLCLSPTHLDNNLGNRYYLDLLKGYSVEAELEKLVSRVFIFF